MKFDFPMDLITLVVMLTSEMIFFLPLEELDMVDEIACD
jgi:hypothetical protein